MGPQALQMPSYRYDCELFLRAQMAFLQEATVFAKSNGFVGARSSISQHEMHLSWRLMLDMPRALRPLCVNRCANYTQSGLLRVNRCAGSYLGLELAFAFHLQLKETR